MEKSSFKFICILVIGLASLSVNAQVLEYVTGRTVLDVRYTDVQGSPYLVENWSKGSVKIANGKVFKDLDLKYDQVADELFFKNDKNEMLGFVEPVKEFKLNSAEGDQSAAIVFRNGYKPAYGRSTQSYYQILSDGETPLVKRNIKKVSEGKPYGSATTVKTFEEVQSYFLVKQGLPVKIKRDRKSVLELLGDYRAELEQFIKTNKLDFKSDTDLIRLMSYYNGLK